MAQRNHASSCQRGNIDHGAGFEALGVGQGIAQNQTPFCVGVQYFDGLTAHAGDHIAGFQGFASRHVFASHDQAHHVDSGLQLGQGLKGAQHTGRTTHIKLHLVHAGAGFERDATCVKGDALTHQHSWRLGVCCALVFQNNKPQRLGRGLRHRRKRTHAKLGNLFQSHHLARYARMFGDALGHLGQMLWGSVVSRTVTPFTSKRDTCHLSFGQIELRF